MEKIKWNKLVAIVLSSGFLGFLIGVSFIEGGFGVGIIMTANILLAMLLGGELSKLKDNK